MKFLKLSPALLIWTAAYYLAGVFITSDWNTSTWDSEAKFLTLFFVWLPGSALISGLYYEKGGKW